MPLSIVMYHYVRDLEHSLYPGIKGRTVAEFEEQLDYIEDQHTVVTADEIAAAVKGDHDLPSDAAWLTFDDGYIDHYTNVFPRLQDRGWQGAFFPTSETVLDRALLDVNKVHFILAVEPNTDVLVARIKDYIDAHQNDEDVSSFADYWKDLAHPSRFDPADVIFVKRIMQRGLPEQHRNRLTAELFHAIVSSDTRAFANELYLSPEQMKTMIQGGMYFGSHGARHYWLDRLSPADQAADIDASLKFLREMGAPLKDWVMCYPHGAYNSTVQDVLKERGCAFALTTKGSETRIGIDPDYALPRLDTNDLPVPVRDAA